MIVDDRIAIIGSANINDRSLLGGNDSEIAAVIEDCEQIKITVNGQPSYVRKFAHDLRKKLCAGHLGLTDGGASIDDPYKGFEMFKTTAEQNTQLYESVFPYIPSERICTLDEMKGDQLQSPGLLNTQALASLSKVQGFVTKYPLSWLFDEKLTGPLNPLVVPYVKTEPLGGNSKNA